MNTITIRGNIGKEPELRYTSNQMAVLEFSVASTSGKDDKKKTTWFSVKVFGQLAENVAGTIVKGDSVIIVGRMETDEYTKKDGEKKSWTYLIADEVGVSLRWNIWVKDQTGNTMKQVSQRHPESKLFQQDDTEEPF